MDLKKEKFELKINNKKRFSAIIFSFLCILFVLLKFQYINNLLRLNFNSMILGIVVYIFTITSCFQLIWAFLGKTIFKIVNNILIVEMGILFFKIKKEFAVNDISNLRNIPDANSSEYWGVPGLRFYYKKSNISFRYGTKDITLNTELSDSEFEQLKKLINIIK
ncbi:MAG TPA: hypothetical protein VGI43_11610 [Mucilaginibacter sp.]|jgi:hypothetical protein